MLGAKAGAALKGHGNGAAPTRKAAHFTQLRKE